MTKLLIFHYHLLPGGVTGVITSALRAVLDYLPEITQITVVTGQAENIASVYDSANRQLSQPLPDGKLKIEVLPEIAYLNDDTAGNPIGVKAFGQPETSILRLKELLTARYSGENVFWWIHNYHLGKNPIFTAALLDIIRVRPEQRILLQIHDFPECSRYENIAFLREYVKSSLYPVSPGVRYLVINNRDRDFLIQAGIDPAQVFLLHNPIVTDKKNLPERTDARKHLNKLFASQSSFVPDAPVLLYPVRTIRRKNILEAALICKISKYPVNLIVTLPGISEQEKPYSDLVEKSIP